MHAKEDFYQLRLIKIAFFLFITTGVHGRLASYPKNSVVLTGKTNVFTCCTNIENAIFWKLKSVGSQDANDVHDSNGLVNGFQTSGRFSATPLNSSGCQSLIITNVSRGDEGFYSCTDDAGFGQVKGWELIILDSFDCQVLNGKAKYTAVNDIGSPQDVIVMVCVLKYFGDMRPRPVCEWSSGGQLLDDYQHFTETKETTTLNIYIPARTEMNGDQLLCSATIDGESSDKQAPAIWMSSHLIINYPSIHDETKSHEVQIAMAGSMVTVGLLTAVIAAAIGFGMGIGVSFFLFFRCCKNIRRHEQPSVEENGNDGWIHFEEKKKLNNNDSTEQ